MSIRGAKLLKVLAFGLLAILIVGLAAAAMLAQKKLAAENASASPVPGDGPSQLQLHGSDTIAVPPEAIESLGIKAARVEQARSRPLEMYGQLIPNTDRLIRIRLRFAAKVSEIAEVADHDATAAGADTVRRPLSVGDQVSRGQVLAVVFSSELGQKKSELVDNLSQLRLDEILFKEYEENRSALPEQKLLTQRRLVEQDRIAADKAESTLRAWEVADQEIEALKEEAGKVRQPAALRTKEQYQQWARMEVRAPPDWDGTIVEKNATVGEYVDPQYSPPLFQILDRNQMTVVAYPNEDDLPMLQDLPRPIHWTVRLKAQPNALPLESPSGDPRGPIVTKILPNIEATQRTPILQGLVKNPGGRYLSNMAVTATIYPPPPPDTVEIPTTALVDDGKTAFVFVQSDPARPEYIQRRVAVTRRFHDRVHVRSKLTREDTLDGGTEETPAVPLEPGQWVVISGAVELKAALEELQAQHQAAAKPG